jgi:hypothetical protein
MIRNLILLALVTVPLAACGDGSGSSGTAVAQVSPNMGLIDRTTSAGTAVSVAAPAGSTTTSTAPPTVAANPPVSTLNGVATLDWKPPTENSDGSALTNLAGYTVYYGTSADNLSQSVKVSNPGLTAYSVTGLTSGTWYFAVTSYSADGVESSRTATVSTKI